MTDKIVRLRTSRNYIEVEQCDLDLEEALRAAYVINGPVVTLIAEFREEIEQAAIAKAQGNQP
jgi:hypothetical protein